MKNKSLPKTVEYRCTTATIYSLRYKDPSYNDIGLEGFSRMKQTLDDVSSPAALLSLPQANRHLPRMAAADGLVGNQDKNKPPFCSAKPGSGSRIWC